MIKNLKKLFVCIFALIFSSTCVVNIATFAGSWWHWNPNYEDFAPEFPWCPEDCCKEQPFDVSSAKNREFDELGYEISQEYYSRKNLDWSKAPFFNGLYDLCLSTPKEPSKYPPLHDILAQYVFLIQNYINSEDNYKMVLSNLNISTLENLFNVSLKLNPDERATILRALEDFMSDSNQKFDYYSFFKRRKSLNFFDVMFVYSYVCNTDKEDFCGWKEPVENILRKEGIDPKIVVSETLIPNYYF